jgi:hypothetical protein
MAEARNNEVGATGLTVFKCCMETGFGKNTVVIKVIFLSNVE